MTAPVPAPDVAALCDYGHTEADHDAAGACVRPSMDARSAAHAAYPDPVRTAVRIAFERGWDAAVAAERAAAAREAAAVKAAVLDLHVPWYEVNGVRREHTVTVPCSEFGCCAPDGYDCDDSGGDGHEVPACAECRWSDGDVDGYLLWPCPTVRAVAAAVTEAGR